MSSHTLSGELASARATESLGLAGVIPDHCTTILAPAVEVGGVTVSELTAGATSRVVRESCLGPLLANKPSHSRPLALAGATKAHEPAARGTPAVLEHDTYSHSTRVLPSYSPIQSVAVGVAISAQVTVVVPPDGTALGEAAIVGDGGGFTVTGLLVPDSVRTRRLWL